MTDYKPRGRRLTTDHDEIRDWVEARDGRPARAETADDHSESVVRIDFPNRPTDETLEPVSYEEFFETFESDRLAFEYQNEGDDSAESRSHRFVRRAETGIEDAADAQVSAVAMATDPETGVAAGLVVDEIHEDATGYDHWNKNDEYLVFRNESDDPLELTGWAVENSTGNRYVFPDEFVLESNQSVTVHTGSGEDSGRDLYWDSPLAVWQNTGDVLTVTDDENRRVIRVSY